MAQSHSDDLVWQIIGNDFCSFRVKIKQPLQKFCTNKYNIVGLCDRRYCPLANSKMATVIEERGRIFLYIKTAERTHMPNKQWEKIQLPKRYKEALKTIDNALQWWPERIVNKIKQRLTRLKQTLARMRRMETQISKQIMPIKKKAERREEKWEEKAAIRANVEEVIKKELIARLHRGVYDNESVPDNILLDVLAERGEVEEEPEEFEQTDEDRANLRKPMIEYEREMEFDDQPEFVMDEENLYEDYGMEMEDAYPEFDKGEGLLDEQGVDKVDPLDF
mmetsp:Transcript_1329/g.1504  ORF Transcript_1329/g.1504 Transcript_1329/m.1504 type:complete len:278 (+) Transcript_1329:18-851(+)